MDEITPMETTRATTPTNQKTVHQIPEMMSMLFTIAGGEVATRKPSAPDMVWGLEEEQYDLLMSHYRPLVKLAKYDGCYIPMSKENDINPLIYYFRWLFIGTVVALASYQTMYMFCYIVFQADYSSQTALTIVELMWSFQSIMSIFFTIYWRREDYITTLFRTAHKVHNSVPQLEAKQWIYFVMKFGVALIIAVVIMSTLIILSVIFGFSRYIMVDLRCLMAYGEKLIPLQVVLFTYIYFSWVCCMGRFLVFTTAAYFESEHFNKQLAEVGKTDRHVGDELLEHYIKHCQLAKVIYLLDQTFEVYVFFMLASNIPATIFSLIAFFMNLRASWHSALVALPSVVFCMITLLGLTVVPAKLHKSITDVVHILYDNERIWKQHDDKAYQIAQVFITHGKQSILGISVWGFAVVSKPLILTTVSLTISYLSFVLELKSNFVPSALPQNNTN
ncbi:hypothetical protein L596_013456 [Steinernema carpocapsae]|uniref:Gustatory receptor n=1 Tax=Steinernema carpocapsae TaxID=34508 RepID=A0A4U5P132_STECR|nr:hypothetical protein L596_013456 [Steinernema carpocapsae]